MFSIGATGVTRTEVQTLIGQHDDRGDLTQGHKDALAAALDALPESDSYTATVSGTDNTFELRLSCVLPEEPPIAA